MRDKTQSDAIDAIQNVTNALGSLLLQRCPQSRELSIAITKLDEMYMWAHKALSLPIREDSVNVQQNPSSEKE